jgi:DNA-binding response OmpR family regulator
LSTDKKRLSIVVINDSHLLLDTLGKWFASQGHQVATLAISDHRDLYSIAAQTIAQHQADVVVIDVGIPYVASYDVADVLRYQIGKGRVVLTTSNKTALTNAVGQNDAWEVQGQPKDLQELMAAVEAAATRS